MQRLTQFSLDIGAKTARNGLPLLYETALCLTALLFTLADISCKALLFIFRKTAGVLIKLIFTLLLAVLFIFVYSILMAIYGAIVGPGLNSNIS